MWVLAAVLRTVAALPRLHPVRLAEERGSSRVLVWAALPSWADPAPGAGPWAVLTRAARDPNLPVGDEPRVDDPTVALAGAALGWLGDGVRRLTAPQPARAARAPSWAGAVVRLPGAWLPSLAVLPRTERGVDDPGTVWPTESADFAARFSVYAESARYAADVLAPHVMALAVDRLPARSALTIAGDALHVWWPHVEAPRRPVTAVAEVVAAAAQLADALPSFVLADYLDESSRVESTLADRAAAARAYRAARRLGQSADPVLQAMYDQARAQAGLAPPANP